MLANNFGEAPLTCSEMVSPSKLEWFVLALQSVITSYSIHYTKLYESFRRRSEDGLGAVNR